MEDDFLALVRERTMRLHRFWKLLRHVEKAAEKYPFRVAHGVRLFVYRESSSRQRDLLHRFGTEVYLDNAFVVAPDCVPDELLEFHRGLVRLANAHPEVDDVGAMLEAMDERFPGPWRGRQKSWAIEFRQALAHTLLFAHTADLIDEAAQEADRNGEDPDRVVCNQYLQALRLWPAGLACALYLEQESPRDRESETVLLTSWVASQISLRLNRELRAALDTGTCTPFENLLRELPAAALAEWHDGGRFEGLATLRNRTALHLKKGETKPRS